MSRGAVAVVALLTLFSPVLGAGRAAAQAWPSELPPGPLAARDVEFPPYEVRTLPNGLQVVAVPHHEQPAVSVRLLVRTGAAQNPPDKPGLASLVGSLLDQGTLSGRTAQDIAGLVDSIGGAIGTGAGNDLSFATLIVMKDSLPLAFDLLSDIIRAPRFAEEEIDRQRQQIESGFTVSLQDPGFVANVVFNRLVYGFHPYGMPTSGIPTSIAAITRDDLVAFHERYFVPNNCVIAVVGDVSAEEAFRGVEAVFGDWERRPVPETELPEPPQPTRRVVVVDMPDAVQTEIRAGHLAIERQDADYLPLNLAVKILGGEGSNRLQQVLRSQRGLTYGASAEMDAMKVAGDIMAETSTRSTATTEALRVTVDEFWKMQRGRVGRRELQDSQAYLSGNFPLTIETPSDIALQVLNNVFYELDLDELETYRERLNAVTPEEIQRVSRLYLRPDRLSIVLVGNAEAFVDELEGAGFESYEVVPIDLLSLEAADFRRRPSIGAASRDGDGPHD